MKYALLGCLLTLVQILYAQIQISEIDALKQKRDFSGALEKVEQYLKSNPGTALEWQLHAELTFMEYYQRQQPMSTFDLPNEDIFSDNIYDKPSPPKMPDTLMVKIIKSLQNATSKDPTLSSAHLAICLTYAQAGQARDLITYLPVFNVSQPEFVDAADLMTKFADQFVDRGEFDEAMQVYAAIVMLYPQNGDVQSKMSKLFFDKGILKASEAYLKMFLASGSANADSYATMFECASLMGLYEEAETCLALWSGLEKKTIYLSYEGLLDWYNNEESKLSWDKFQKSPDNSLSIGAMVQYMNRPDFNNSLSDFDYLMKLDLPDPYKIVIIDKYRTFFPSSCAIRHHYTEMLTAYQRYSDALDIFYSSSTENCEDKVKMAHDFYAGWCNYRLKSYAEATMHFTRVLNSTDPFQQSCAAYFLGKMMEVKNDFTKATEFYTLGKAYAKNGKFGKLCEMNLAYLEQNEN